MHAYLCSASLLSQWMGSWCSCLGSRTFLQQLSFDFLNHKSLTFSSQEQSQFNIIHLYRNFFWHSIHLSPLFSASVSTTALHGKVCAQLPPSPFHPSFGALLQAECSAWNDLSGSPRPSLLLTLSCFESHLIRFSNEDPPTPPQWDPF